MNTFVVLDTNIYFNDYYLTNPDFRKLGKACELTQLTWCLPEVVQEESVRHFNSAIRKLHKETEKLQKSLQQITQSELHLTLIDYEDQEKRLREFFRNRFHNSQTGKFIPVRNSGVRHIFERDIQRKKPFTEQGAGFRDQLIWMSIVYLLQENKKSKVVFITKNAKDFFDSAGKLHKDFIEDLHSKKLDLGRIQTYNSLKSFISENLEQLFSTETDILQSLNSAKWSPLSYEKLSKAISEEINESFIELNLPDSNSPEAFVSDIAYLKITNFENVTRLKENEIDIDFDIEFEGTFTYYVDKSDYYSDHEEPTYEVIDGDYNDHVMEVEITQTISARGFCFFDLAEKEIMRIALFDLEPRHSV